MSLRTERSAETYLSSCGTASRKDARRGIENIGHYSQVVSKAFFEENDAEALLQTAGLAF